MARRICSFWLLKGILYAGSKKNNDFVKDPVIDLPDWCGFLYDQAVMKILVTGGAGFIGSHLCGRLLDGGHEVFCVDNFVTGSRENVKGELVEHDVSEPMGDKLPEGVGRIYHLASPASPKDYREIPLQTLWVNASGTKNMLDIAAKNGIPMLMASTSEVYGDPHEHPQQESYYGHVNPIGERSCYDEGKRYAESLCVNYYKQFRFPLRIARIFNTYGPGMRKLDGRAIPEFISNALQGEPLNVNGDGLQTRSFCYIDDMVDGLIKLMDLEKEYAGPVNLGNPDEITIKELAETIIQLTNSESLISHTPKPEDDPNKRCPDIRRAKELIGFDPKIPLAEGLEKTISYFQNLK
jgi:UDP-glucuronate decarboxylase